MYRPDIPNLKTKIERSGIKHAYYCFKDLKKKLHSVKLNCVPYFLYTSNISAKIMKSIEDVHRPIDEQ